MATPRDKIQDMLCEKIDALETVIEASAKSISNTEGLIDLMENRRNHEPECREAATAARTHIREVAKTLYGALKGKP